MKFYKALYMILHRSHATIHFIAMNDNIKVFYFGTICNLAFSAKFWRGCGLRHLDGDILAAGLYHNLRGLKFYC